MGFFADRRLQHVRVRIVDAPVADPDFDLSGFHVGETYEVAPRVAEYLLGSRHAIIERRHDSRAERSTPPRGA